MFILQYDESWDVCLLPRQEEEGVGGEEEEEESEGGSWRNQSPNNTIMIRGLPSGVTEEEVGNIFIRVKSKTRSIFLFGSVSSKYKTKPLILADLTVV